MATNKLWISFNIISSPLHYYIVVSLILLQFLFPFCKWVGHHDMNFYSYSFLFLFLRFLFFSPHFQEFMFNRIINCKFILP